MLVSGTLSSEMSLFIKEVNKMKQEDADIAIDAYCKRLESAVYTAIRSLTITIPPLTIAVSGGPTAQSNPAPIVLTNMIS